MGGLCCVVGHLPSPCEYQCRVCSPSLVSAAAWDAHTPSQRDFGYWVPKLNRNCFLLFDNVHTIAGLLQVCVGELRACFTGRSVPWTSMGYDLSVPNSLPAQGISLLLSAYPAGARPWCQGRSRGTCAYSFAFFHFPSGSGSA